MLGGAWVVQFAVTMAWRRVRAARAVSFIARVSAWWTMSVKKEG